MPTDTSFLTLMSVLFVLALRVDGLTRIVRIVSPARIVPSVVASRDANITRVTVIAHEHSDTITSGVVVGLELVYHLQVSQLEILARFVIAVGAAALAGR